MRLTRILLEGLLLVEAQFGLLVVYGVRPYCNSISRPGTSHFLYGGREVSQCDDRLCRSQILMFMLI